MLVTCIASHSLVFKASSDLVVGSGALSAIPGARQKRAAR